MITYFQVNGVMYYVNRGKAVGYEDVFRKMDMCRMISPKWALARIS